MPFKVRSAEPMSFEGNWEVALTSLSIPDNGRTLSFLTDKEKNDIVFLTVITMLRTNNRRVVKEIKITGRDLQEQKLVMDGVD